MGELACRKSSRSGSSTNCVDAARATDRIAVGDSKNPEGGHVRVDAFQWRAFVGGLKGGRFPVSGRCP
ncbi:DUF397 domain-containing protein [Saccharopolyspora rhizosphaerae]|uniref:DUF397 domain-containing protein n=1 Tax=Saccharopolyspora rhizosphaerae TaxID=2492662 RepID=A0A426JR44_9PSEU|nr:DUF397 domain-containing protein [Saccharopolyspora rhizosphaerae]RRO15614.1 DUF397 domain-containing protein [Saccharopolyspora rhizosphaerae]